MDLFHKIDKAVLRSIKAVKSTDNRETTKLYTGIVNGVKTSNTNLSKLRALGATKITNRNGTKLPS